MSTQVTFGLTMLLALLKLFLHDNSTVFWLNNGSTKEVWGAVEKLVIMVVNIEDKWRVAFQILLHEHFVV